MPEDKFIAEAEHEQDHPVDHEQAADEAAHVEQVRGARRVVGVELGLTAALSFIFA